MLNDDNAATDSDSENTISNTAAPTETIIKNQHDASNKQANTSCSFLGNELRSTKSLSNVEDCKKLDKQNKIESNTTSTPVEVFLGGSCNPTTWRADVAIPALKELGISFYNPVRDEKVICCSYL